MKKVLPTCSPPTKETRGPCRKQFPWVLLLNSLSIKEANLWMTRIPRPYFSLLLFYTCLFPHTFKWITINFRTKKISTFIKILFIFSKISYNKCYTITSMVNIKLTHYKYERAKHQNIKCASSNIWLLLISMIIKVF